MARFDLYQNLNDDGYLLDVQTDLLGGLNTRKVVPIMPVNKAPQSAILLKTVKRSPTLWRWCSLGFERVSL
jgi:toxin CcdB